MLRRSLDSASFNHTQIVVSDNAAASFDTIATAMASDSAFARSFLVYMHPFFFFFFFYYDFFFFLSIFASVFAFSFSFSLNFV